MTRGSMPRAWLALLTAMLLVCGFLSTASASAAVAKPRLPKPHKTKLLPHRTLKPTSHATPSAVVRSHLRSDRTWPGASSVTFGPTVAAARAEARRRAHIATISGHHAPTGASRIGLVSVHLLSHAAAARVHVDGVLLAVSRLTSSHASLSLTLHYAKFINAAGANFGPRLQLVRLPRCALTSPARADCQRQTPVLSQNSASSNVLRGILRPTATSEATPAGRSAVLPPSARSTVVLAATATASSPGGTFTATSLAPSGSWGATGNTGSFTWSYPITTPPSVAGSDVTPSVSLSYNSATTDGRTSATNDQASWAGEGWDYSPGYIERSYVPCTELTSLPTARQTHDLCWDGQIVSLSLGGSSTPVVQDGSSGQWRLQNDDGSRVQLVGAATNGAYQGEYWVVTQPSGVQYFFGKDTLPGGTSSQNTNATWTEPVFGATTSDPCYSATIASSHCTQAWRWNLDYVVDPNGNATAYYYNAPETNYYALDGKTTVKPVEYDRGGTLKEIDYGLRLANNSIYGSSAPDKVLFTVAQRCVPSGTVTCTAAQFTVANQANWPDSPADLVCSSTATSCANTSPSYWSNMKLTTIKTQVDVSGTYQTIDSYALNQSFPTSGDAELRLDSIVRTASATNGSTSITLPTVKFSYELLANHVSGVNGQPDLDEWRMSSLETETGEIISISYDQSGRSAPLCTSATLPSTPSTNTTECFPVIWTPLGDTKPITDYFHKYVVTEVQQQDVNGTAPPRQTTYTYLGSPAWHYDDNEVVKPSQRTWGQFRGYAQVQTRTGNTATISNGVANQLTLSTGTYFRGMDGDTLPGGATRSASVSDSLGSSYTDSDQYAGTVLETQTFNGDTSAEVSAQITVPETVATTATRTRTGLPPLVASMVRTKNSTRYTDLAAGGTMNARAEFQYDTSGRVIDESSSATHALTKCTQTTYADPPAPLQTSSWIRNRVAEVVVGSGACPTDGSAATPALSDVRTYYDQTTGSSTPLGSVPGAGNPTEIDTATQAVGAPANWAVTTTSYDASGRVVSQTTNVASGNRTTTTAYTPAVGGPLTQVKITNPLLQSSTTTLDPGRGTTTKTVDVAGHVTTATYDALGRLTAVWDPGQVQGTNSATDTYAYTLGQSAPLAVTSKALVDAGNGTTPAYHTTVDIYDAFGSLRQSQTQAPNNANLVIDSFNDSHGWVIGTNNGWPTTGAPGTTILTTNQSAINDSTQTSYDGTGRPVLSTEFKGTTATSTTRTVYDGDSTTVVPPTGGVETTTSIDANGNTTALQQWQTAPTIVTSGVLSGGTAVTSTYSYDPLGRRLTMTNAVGTAVAATWSTTYDMAGRAIAQVDPDSGTTTSSYDAAGELTSTTDANGTVLDTTYDAVGRKTGVYQNSVSAGNQLSGWTYDTAQAGQLASETTYGAGGNQYTVKDTSYDGAGRLLSTEVDLPASLVTAGFAATYTTKYSWTTTGLEASETPAAGGSLPAEPLAFTYNNLGEPTALQGLVNYLTTATYDPFGDPTQYGLGVNNQAATLTYAYDPQTLRLTAENLSALQAVPQIDNVAYSYDLSGNVLKSVDTQGGGSGAPVETQCYDYDSLDRLTEAWSATDNCASDPNLNGVSTVGGPEPYWTSWSFNAANERTQQFQNAVPGGLTDSDTTTYTNGGSQTASHALAATSSVNSESASTGSSAYSYNPNGSTSSRTVNGVNQTFGYTPEGLTSGVTTGSLTASYVYDADGDELVASDGTVTTLYLPDEELALDSSTGTITGTRYYSVNGTVVAERVGHSNDDYLLADPQGTAEVADPTTQTGTGTPIRREFDPYGNQLGTTSGGTWPDQHEFLNKPTDPTSGLSQLGARQYDPATGRFLSVDPVLESEPLEDNGYSYAANNPETNSDPSGLYYVPGDGPGCIQGCVADPTPGNDMSPNYVAPEAQGPTADLPATFNDGLGATLKVLAKATATDFTGCAHGSLTSCGMAAFDVASIIDLPDPAGDAAVGSIDAARIVDLTAEASSDAPKIADLTAQAGNDSSTATMNAAHAAEDGSGLVDGANGALRDPATGRFAPNPDRAEPEPSDGLHGNSRLSDQPTSLYQLYDLDGNYLKTGISSDPAGRYTQDFMSDKFMDIINMGSRSDMMDLERQIVEYDPGPLNFEPWAGAAR